MLAPFALPAFLLLIPAFLQETAAPETEVRSYDVRLIERALVSEVTPIGANTHLIPGFGDVVEGWRIPWAPNFPLPSRPNRDRQNPGLIVDWERAFERLLSPVLSPPEGSEVELGPGEFDCLDSLPGSLRVAASASVQRSVGELLNVLEAHALHTVEAAIYLLDAESIPRGTPVILDSNRVQELLTAGTILREEHTILRADDVVYLRECAKHAFKQWIAVHMERERYTDLPAQVGVAHQGFQIALDVKPSFSGGYSLRTCTRRGFDLDIDSHRVSFFNQEEGLEEGVLDLPSLRSEQFGGDAVLPEGGGLLLGEQRAATGSLRILITLRTKTPGPTHSPFIPTGNAFATPTQLNASKPALGSDQGWSGMNDDEDDPDEYVQIRKRELERMFDVLLGSEDLSLPTKRTGWFGSRIRLHGAREQVEESKRLLESMLSRSERQLAFELRFGELDAADLQGSATTASSDLNLEILAEHLPDRAFGACTAGSRSLMSSWLETSYPGVRSVHRASKYNLADASVWVVHDGYSASVGWNGDAESGCTLDVEFYAQQVFDEEAIIPGPSPWPRAERIHFTAPIRIEFQGNDTATSRWALVGQTSGTNSDRSFIAIARVVQ